MALNNASPLALSAALTTRTNALALGLEHGAADLLELVTPTTAELLQWWFGEDMVAARSGLNFHAGQKQAILNAIVAHEVLGAASLLDLYQQVAPDALLADNRLADVGMALRDQASLAALTEDVVKTSEIEGEVLNVASVRSSIARHLGVDIGAVAPVDRHAVERAAGEAVEPATGRVRWQAHQQQVGGDCQVFARHRIARHYPACGVRRPSKGTGWWS